MMKRRQQLAAQCVKALALVDIDVIGVEIDPSPGLLLQRLVHGKARRGQRSSDGEALAELPQGQQRCGIFAPNAEPADPSGADRRLNVSYLFGAPHNLVSGPEYTSEGNDNVLC